MYRKMKKNELLKHVKMLEERLKQFESDDNILKKETLSGLKDNIDETELLNFRNMLEESRDKYADLYDYAPIGYMSLNDKGVITEINLSGASILRKGKKYLNNTPFIYFLAGNEINRFLKYLKDCRLKNSPIVDNFMLNLNDKKELYIKMFIVPFPDYVSKKISYRVVMYDDSERIRAEKALKESEVRFSNLADTVPVLIWMFNKDEKLEYINKQRFNFTGLSAEQEESNWFENVHPLDVKLYKQKYKDAFKLHKKFSIEYRLKKHNNEYHWLLETTIPRYTDEKEFLGLIGTGIDITERKKARIVIENSLKEKELLVKEKELLVKEIHHRVKNNLQIVSSLLNLQSFYVKDPKVLDLIKGSQERIRSMALVHEKLYRSKDLLKIDFDEYSKELISHLFQSYRKNTNVRLNLDIPRTLLGINTAISLGLILNELVSNSLKYAFNGRKEGEISIILLYKKRNNLELIVRDDGIGFPKDFDIANSEGMGLELVESLVQQHNGSLNIIKDGKTEFQISIEMEKEKPKPDEILKGN